MNITTKWLLGIGPLALAMVGLAQVPRPGDDRPDFPDFLPAEQQSRSILSQHTPGAPAARPVPGAQPLPLAVVAQAGGRELPNAVAEQADAGAAPADFADQHVVQVGAFADPANAARLLKILQQKGFPILTRSTIDEAGGTLTRVLAGPYANRGAALSAKEALEADGWLGFVRTEPVPEARAIYVTQETGPQSAEAPMVDAQPELVPEARAIYVTQETGPQSAEAPTVKAQPEPATNLPRIDTSAGVEATPIATTPRVRFSVSPRVYYTFIDTSDFSEVGGVWMGGLSLTAGPADGNWDLTLNALFGDGDSDFTGLAENVWNQTGQWEIDRVDYEALWRYRLKDSPAYVGFGVRFIDVEEQYIGDFSGGLEVDTTEIWLGEIAVGFSMQVSEGSRHALFSNLLIGVGAFDFLAVEVGEPDIADDGTSLIVDANLGYQYVINQTSSFSTRYRVIAVQSSGLEDELDVVHGPEVAFTFRF